MENVTNKWYEHQWYANKTQKFSPYDGDEIREKIIADEKEKLIWQFLPLINPDLEKSLEFFYEPGTEEYNNSLIGIILNALNYLNIPLSQITVEELERCRNVIFKRYSRLYHFHDEACFLFPVVSDSIFNDKKKYSESNTHSYVDYFIEVLCEELEKDFDSIGELTHYSDEPYDRYDEIYKEIYEQFYSIVTTIQDLLTDKNGIYSIDELNEQILKLRKEIARVHQIVKPYVRDSWYPHLNALDYLNNVIPSYIDFINEIKNGEYEGMINWNAEAAGKIIPDAFYSNNQLAECKDFYRILCDYINALINKLKIIEDSELTNTGYDSIILNITKLNSKLSSRHKSLSLVRN